jgi:hypothetical protein
LRPLGPEEKGWRIAQLVVEMHLQPQQEGGRNSSAQVEYAARAVLWPVKWPLCLLGTTSGIPIWAQFVSGLFLALLSVGNLAKFFSLLPYTRLLFVARAFLTTPHYALVVARWSPVSPTHRYPLCDSERPFCARL